tara:strand:+ start:2302 stop:2460 length:159 start_codon:yes stop_codon:yes gene_type:complete
MEKLKMEYLNLCTTFGSIEVDSIISYNTYCRQRKIYSASQLYNDVEDLMSID